MAQHFDPTQQIILSVLFFQDPTGAWIAQSLERDIAAYGPTFDAARIAFERTVNGYFELDARLGREPLSALQPAPPVYWDAWKRVSLKKGLRGLADQEIAEDVPPAFMIEAITTEALPIAR